MPHHNDTRLTNGLPYTYLSDRMPLDHWFHAFQTTFGDMLVAAPDPISACLQDRSGLAYGYDAAMTVYAECFVRPLPGPSGANHDPQAGVQ